MLAAADSVNGATGQIGADACPVAGGLPDADAESRDHP